MCELLPSKINHLNQVVQDKQKKREVDKRLKELKQGKKINLNPIKEKEEENEEIKKEDNLTLKGKKNVETEIECKENKPKPKYKKINI